jgi:hypothetical protein
MAAAGWLGTGGAVGAGGAAEVSSGGATGTVAAGGAGGAKSTDAGATRDAPGIADSAQLACRPAPPCPSGWNYVYNDSACTWGGTVSICTPRGDGLCYQECKADSDCTNPIFPTCGSIELANGSDYPGSRKGVCVGGPRCRGDAGT